MTNQDPKEYALIELCNFINNRLDDTERTALAASPGAWRYANIDSIAGGAVYDTTRSIASVHYETPQDHDGSIVRLLPEREADANGDHIAAHDPAAILLDVKAKRRIVATMRSTIDHAWQDDMNTRVLVLALVSRTLRHLAHLYDTHPDYLQEWKLWIE